MSGFGPKSQSHPAVSARTSGSASGRQEASAGGSSSTNRSYATWLTCIFNLWVSRQAVRATVPGEEERGLVRKYRPDQAERRRRGSSASRSASPRKLKAKTAVKMATPGPTLIHHLRFARYLWE